METNRQMGPPVKEGDKFLLDIEGFGKRGDPFGKVTGFVLFIRLNPEEIVKENEKYWVEVTRVFSSHAFAVLSEEPK